MYQVTVRTVRLAGAKAETHSLEGMRGLDAGWVGPGSRVGGAWRQGGQGIHARKLGCFIRTIGIFSAPQKSIFHLSTVSG